jgi:hypothetical protein
MCSFETMMPYILGAVALAVVSGARWEELLREAARRKLGLDDDE